MKLALCAIRAQVSRHLTAHGLTQCSTDAFGAKEKKMKKSDWLIISSLFCKNCDSLFSMKSVKSYPQIGTLNTSSPYGNRKSQRHESVYTCQKCGYEKHLTNYI